MEPLHVLEEHISREKESEPCSLNDKKEDLIENLNDEMMHD